MCMLFCLEHVVSLWSERLQIFVMQHVVLCLSGMKMRDGV